MSFPQFPYGSPAELTRSKHIPGAGFAPAHKDKHGKEGIAVTDIKEQEMYTVQQMHRQ